MYLTYWMTASIWVVVIGMWYFLYQRCHPLLYGIYSVLLGVSVEETLSQTWQWIS